MQTVRFYHFVSSDEFAGARAESAREYWSLLLIQWALIACQPESSNHATQTSLILICLFYCNLRVADSCARPEHMIARLPARSSPLPPAACDRRLSYVTPASHSDFVAAVLQNNGGKKRKFPFGRSTDRRPIFINSFSPLPLALPTFIRLNHFFG